MSRYNVYIFNTVVEVANSVWLGININCVSSIDNPNGKVNKKNGTDTVLSSFLVILFLSKLKTLSVNLKLID